MPKTVEYLSLNKAADKCGISRQDFRKYVGEFEKQGTYLPNDGEGRKFIPEDFLQIFQRAAMWAQVENTSPGVAMLRALEQGQQYQLGVLAQAVANSTELIKLPREMRQVVHELKEEAKKPRPVSVRLADQKDIAQALASLRVWQGLVCVLLGLAAGLYLGHRFL